MVFKLKYTEEAENQLFELRADPAKHRILKNVTKALGLMQTNLRHPSLNTHEYHSIQGPNGEKFLRRMPNKIRQGLTAYFGTMAQGKIFYLF